MKATFPLAKKYSTALMLLYVCLIFSTGMPVMLPLGFGLFFIIYWIDKYTLLRESSRPNKADSSINSWLSSRLRAALVLHMIAATIMLTVPTLFEPLDVTTSTAASDLIDSQPFTYPGRLDNVHI